ncbi:MAG TPA: hypothetical protein VJT75_09860 [Thermoleophilaceae bacterium]|nr:hypothetical protein [Thermoleophilaceae bacterium]
MDVADGLDAHDADELAAVLVAPELHARGDLVVELARGHVRLVPAVVRYDPAIRGRGGVDDVQDGRAVVGTAGTYLAHARQSKD